MESQEKKYLIEHGFDVKSPFDAEAVEIIMKDYLEVHSKSQKSDSLPSDNDAQIKIDKIYHVLENTPELNMSNYDDDQVRKQDQAITEISNIIG